MDEHNAHHFWGISPAVDFGAVRLDKLGTVDGDVNEPYRVLQVASYDARHTIQTMARASRHLAHHAGPIELYIYEEEPESLARHILLLSILLDGSLPAKERMQVLLEVHGNVVVREKTAKYLDSRGRALEELLVALSSRSGVPAFEGVAPEGRGGLTALAAALDLSLLKYQDKDELVEAVQKYREKVQYDMIKAWDARCRKFYGERYDFMRNMIDWDYHMRLLTAGTPGHDPKATAGHIIHFTHFRQWRLHGVAYELRDSSYSHPNRSLLSTAYGRTKEFKSRRGDDVGRSVSAWGYWGDLLNSPYHCFGVVSEEEAFFKVSNNQFMRTAVDVAEHNVRALLHELRTGERYVLPSGSEPSRAKVARGPTSMEDLTQEAQQEQQQQQQQEEEGGNMLHAVLLIPYRTALRAAFPLNGTYFQPNEVFVDEMSVRSPLQVSSLLLRSLAQGAASPAAAGSPAVNSTAQHSRDPSQSSVPRPADPELSGATGADTPTGEAGTSESVEAEMTGAGPVQPQTTEAAGHEKCQMTGAGSEDQQQAKSQSAGACSQAAAGLLRDSISSGTPESAVLEAGAQQPVGCSTITASISGRSGGGGRGDGGADGGATASKQGKPTAQLPWKTVYFGGATASICRDMTLPEVAFTFNKACICVRSFDCTTGRPVPLPHYLSPGVPKSTSGSAAAAGPARGAPPGGVAAETEGLPGGAQHVSREEAGPSLV